MLATVLFNLIGPLFQLKQHFYSNGISWRNSELLSLKWCNYLLAFQYGDINMHILKQKENTTKYQVFVSIVIFSFYSFPYFFNFK